jgi:hypothetical protein
VLLVGLAAGSQLVQPKGPTQRGHKLLDMEAKKATPLKPITKQHGEGHDEEH